MKYVTNKVFYIIFCLILVAGLQGVYPATALGEGDVRLEVRVGIGGEYKDARMVPLHVTIANGGGDFEGNLIMEAKESNEYTATYYQPVSVGKGATKKITLMVPGENLQSTQVVRLVKGSTEVAKEKIGGRRFDGDTQFIGVMATDPDTANFLAALPKTSFPSPVRLAAMKAEDVPDSYTSMQMLDYLVLNNYSLDQLSKEQVQAIKLWTRQGGTLILAGGPHFGKFGGQFDDLSPVTVSGTATLPQISSLSTGGKQNPPVLTQPLTVSKATVKEGLVLYQQDGMPIIAVGDAGRGKVVYAAYDLAEEPLASWSGNSQLWSQVLLKARGQGGENANPYGRDQVYSLNRAAETFPSLEAPNFMLLTLFFVGYAVIVGPVLFFLFRGKKRRGYLWGVVPSVAVLTCVVIYGYGVFQRGTEVKLANMSYVVLDGAGQAVATSASSMFVPSGGDYQLRLTGVDMALPQRNMFRGGGEEDASSTWVNTTGTTASIEYKGVEHWSIRSAASQKTIQDAGAIESDLRYEQGNLVGTIVNKTKYAIRDAVMVNGKNTQQLGTLALGASVQVNVATDTSLQDGRRRQTFPLYDLIPNDVKSQQGYENSREYRMLDFLDYRYRGGRSYQGDQVQFFGWTDDPVVEWEIPGEKTVPNDLTLISSIVKVKPSADGYVFFPAGTFPAVLVESTANADMREDGFYMNAGEITLDFSIRQGTKPFVPTQVQLYSWSDDGTSFNKQVFNWKSNTYTPYTDVFVDNKLSGAALGEYIAPDGTLRVKFSHQESDQRHLGLPVISVEGKVVN